MATQREAGDFDRQFSAKLAAHLTGGGSFDTGVVGALFQEVARNLGAGPSARDAMDIEQLFAVITPIVGDLRQQTQQLAARRIFSLIFEH